MVNSPINRREFLGTTAVAGAGLLLTSCTPDVGPKTAAKSNLSTINVGVVGLGEEGNVLLEAIRNIDGVKLVAVCDIWDLHRQGTVRRLKKEYGIEAQGYEDYEDMLAKEKDLQAVVVATPDFWHAPITNTCLKAGLHVYCEKMMSNTLDGARSMVKTMRETGKLLQIGHQRRSNPRYLFALNRLLHGANICGRVTALQGQWNRAVKEDFGWPKKSDISPEKLAKYGYKDMHQFRNWRWFKALGGGPLSDLGAHQIDQFPGYRFADDTLSPTAKQPIPDGWQLTWQYSNLVSGFEIGMTMPSKLQPGPLAGEISYAAPVSLFFFFFLMFIITTLRKIDLHPINYFFLATAFFAFHLLLAYLVDHISIHVAMVLASVVSVTLVVSYLRLVVGLRFAALEAGTAQLIYLVLFSYAFFWKGFTGLAITIIAIVTLFVVCKSPEGFAGPSDSRRAAR